MSFFSQTQEYKQIDRILRVIYKVLPYDSLVGEQVLSPQFNDLFDLGRSSQFKKIVIDMYMNLYPGNYNEDSVSKIIDYVSDIIKERYGSTNAIYLISYISQTILEKKHSNLEVNHENLLEWDGLINKLSSDIFIAAYSAQNRINICNHTVGTNNKKVEQLLSKGIADNHMHLKASGYTVEMNWYHFTRLSIFSKKLDEFVKNDHVFRNGMKGKETQIKNALMLRKTKLLRNYFKNLIQNNNNSSINKQLLYYLIQTNDNATFIAHAEALPKDWDDSMSNGNELNLNRLKSYYQEEREFLAKLFSKVYDGELGIFNLAMFNLYILMSNQIKFMLVQDNVGMGFTKFKHYEDIKEVFIPDTSANSKELLRTVFKKYYLEFHVRSIEVRIAPKNTPEQYHTFAIQLNKINEEVYAALKEIHPDLVKMKVSVVIHFIKYQSDQYKRYLPRFNDLRDILKQKVSTLEYYLEKGDKSDKNNPRLLYSGIDAANYEVNCPPEIFGPSFRRIKAVDGCRQIGQTYHVGEEFSSLLSGLRAIDETLEFLEYEPNDRLGHALALGIDVKEFFRTKRDLLQETVREYFDDIVWSYHQLESKDYVLKDYLINKFRYLISNYFLPNNSLSRYAHYNIREFYLAWVLRGSDPYEVYDIHYRAKKVENTYLLNAKAKDFEEAIQNPNARLLYLDYHFKEDIRDLDQKIHLGTIDEEYISVVTKVQESLLKKVSSRRVFVEANPTSNKKISSITKYTKLPLFKITPIGECDYRISSSINTDDSSIFQTNLCNEYYIIAAALIRDEIDPDKVYHYIEQLVDNSNLHTF